jgi:lipopolysaccharide export system protein LptA
MMPAVREGSGAAMNRTIRTALAAAALAAGWAASASGAAAQIGPQGGPIEVRATQLEALRDENRIIYSGAVDAVQGSTRIRANTLTIVCSPAEGAEAGAPAAGCGEVERMIAEGDVYYITPEEKVRGDRAEYDYVNDTITVTGDVILTRGDEGVINGRRLVIEVATGRAVVTSEGRPVFSVFTPSEREPDEAEGASPPAAAP